MDIYQEAEIRSWLTCCYLATVFKRPKILKFGGKLLFFYFNVVIALIEQFD